jgi:SAM-dependent methyltransferase
MSKSFVRYEGGRFHVDKTQRFDSFLIDTIILDELVTFLNEHFKAISPRILDAGAGTMPYFPVYANYFRESYSFDTSFSPHDIASVDVIATAQRLPFPDLAFDCVLCTEVLEHVSDPVLALTEFRRVLKNGGRLFLTIPFFNPLHELPHDYFRYTPFALRDMARRAGFQLKSVVEKGGLIAFAILFLQYPWIRFWQRLSHACGVPLAHPGNPLIYLTVTLPQLVYLRIWKKMRRRRFTGFDACSHNGDLSPVTLGYVATFTVTSTTFR